MKFFTSSAKKQPRRKVEAVFLVLSYSTTGGNGVKKSRPTPTENRMSIELLNPDNTTIELIQEIFEQAYMDATLDEEKRQIRLREEGVIARAYLSESKERLQLYALYGIKEEAQRAERLELANRINENYVLIRAGIDDDGDLWFDYCVLLKGGVTRKAIVQATRIFMMLFPKAVNECDDESIVE